MKFNCRFMIYAISTALVLTSSAGLMFDIHLIETPRNSTKQERHCKDLGYDGLAVISTPETFLYALKLTEYSRNVLDQGAYIGAHYRPDVGLTMWDDDTIPTTDAPFANRPPKADPTTPYGRLHEGGHIIMADGVRKRYALCGYYKSSASESSGETLDGQLQTTMKTILSVSKVFSYMECAVLCGMVIECRAAELNSDLLTCTVIGDYTSSGYTANAKVKTYVRHNF
ncbi:hypothetical protein RRG08_004988 [Elysia crispata]|uniref:Uncharacterized protein n=1 Tax=Elysia crispata TaxID=231223 RepID=A0AAE0XXB8_9GAST|nr:hypothetical protein RRG08_004988 [Elysia crispata]